MKRTSWQRRSAGSEDGLSLFLTMYVLGLVGVLLAVHVLQPAWGNPGSASWPPLHQQKAAKQTAAWKQ